MMSKRLLSLRKEENSENCENSSDSVKVVFSFDPKLQINTPVDASKSKKCIEFDINVDVDVHHEQPHVGISVNNKRSLDNATTVHNRLLPKQGEIDEIKYCIGDKTYREKELVQKDKSSLAFLRRVETVEQNRDFQDEGGKICLSSNNEVYCSKDYEGLEKVFAQIVDEYNKIFNFNEELVSNSRSICGKGAAKSTIKRFEQWCKMSEERTVESNQKQKERGTADLNSNTKYHLHNGTIPKRKANVTRPGIVSLHDMQTQTPRKPLLEETKNRISIKKETKGTQKYCKCNPEWRKQVTIDKEAQTAELHAETSIEEYLKPSEKRPPTIGIESIRSNNPTHFETKRIATNKVEISNNESRFTSFTEVNDGRLQVEPVNMKKLSRLTNIMTDELLQTYITVPRKEKLKSQDNNKLYMKDEVTQEYIRLKEDGDTFYRHPSYECENVVKRSSEQENWYDTEITRELLDSDGECIFDFPNSRKKPEAYIELLADNMACAIKNGRQEESEKTEKICWKRLELSKCFSSDKLKTALNNNVKTIYKNLQKSKDPIYSKSYKDDNTNLLEKNRNGNDKYTPDNIDITQQCIDSKRNNTQDKMNMFYKSYEEETKEMDRIQKLDELINTLWPE